MPLSNCKYAPLNLSTAPVAVSSHKSPMPPTSSFPLIKPNLSIKPNMLPTLSKSKSQDKISKRIKNLKSKLNNHNSDPKLNKNQSPNPDHSKSF